MSVFQDMKLYSSLLIDMFFDVVHITIYMGLKILKEKINLIFRHARYTKIYPTSYSSCAVRKYVIRREKFLLERHRGGKGQFMLTCRYERACTELQSNAVISNSTFHIPNHPPKANLPKHFIGILIRAAFHCG